MKTDLGHVQQEHLMPKALSKRKKVTPMPKSSHKLDDLLRLNLGSKRMCKAPQQAKKVAPTSGHKADVLLRLNLGSKWMSKAPQQAKEVHQCQYLAMGGMCC